jgi:CBS domain containing-hemolysin-like protein
MIWNIIAILGLIGLNAFFVSVEIAALTSRKARIEKISESDSNTADIVISWLENQAVRDKIIAGVQLGVTAVNLALGAVGENTFEALLSPLFVGAQLPASMKFLFPVIGGLPLVLF